jgi:hypothetical protein
MVLGLSMVALIGFLGGDTFNIMKRQWKNSHECKFKIFFKEQEIRIK